MLWPIGQPFGDPRQLAARSLQIWLEVLASARLWHERSGSLHLAYRNDEAQVLREFADESRGHGQPVELLTPAEVCERSAAVKRDGLELGLWSAEETSASTRSARSRRPLLPEWLARRFGVDFHFGQGDLGRHHARK